MGRKRDDFHLLRGDPVADIAIDFRVLISFVFERSALAADRRAIGLWPIGLRSLEIGYTGLFRVRREPEAATRDQQAGQSEYALLDPQHRQTILRVQSTIVSFSIRGP
jgi:hypothetical protein